ncbi:MAG: hypothetical protein ABWZ82_01190 [Candidatus Limnocylindrales bacterium]
MSEPTPPFQVVTETAEKRAFASAAAWPGWSRSGKDEALALEQLASYAPRYARVAAKAGLSFPERVTTADLEVVERTPGGSGTAFGVPGRVAEVDLHRVSSAEARRLTDIVIACWDVLADVVAAAPAELRKGPRGGGRDRDKVVAHVEESERSYARSIGIELPPTAPITAVRAEIVEVLGLNSDGSPLPGGAWTQRYAARRIAWHILDHAWEIEDRSEPHPG